MSDALNTKIKLGPAVGSFVNLFKPRAVNAGDEPKYGMALLFNKKTAAKQLAELARICEAVAALKFGPQWKNIKGFKLPIRDGDAERPEDKAYAGKMFVSTSSQRQPGVVNRSLQPIMDAKDAYSGCNFIAAVNVFAYDKGNKGVALGLNNVMVHSTGTRIDGQKDAAEDFAEYVGDDAGGESSSGEIDPMD